MHTIGTRKIANATECRVHINVTNDYVQVSLLHKHLSLKRGASREELELCTRSPKGEEGTVTTHKGSARVDMPYWPKDLVAFSFSIAGEASQPS